MLLDLSIRNIVLIDSLDIDFSGGLTGLTGETGAGKSILLDSMSLVLGARSDQNLLRKGADRAVVGASFQLSPHHSARPLLADMEIACGNTLHIRRILSADGRSRAFVEDQPVNIGFLKKLGDLLVEMQGQFDQHGLMDSSTHCSLLDSFAGLNLEVKAVKSLRLAWQERAEELEQARHAAEIAARDADWLRHSLDEIEKIAPEQENEEQTLSSRRDVLMNAEKITQALSQTMALLSSAEGADSKISDALGILERQSEKAGGRFDSVTSQLERILDETADAVGTLNRIGHDIESNETELEEVEERLFALREIARKHRVTPPELPELHQKLARQCALIEEGAIKFEALEEAVTNAQYEWQKQAELLSQKRIEAVGRFNSRVNDELPALKLEKAQFQAQISRKPENEWPTAGLDEVVFLISTNPGLPPAPLRKVASGGELSRILLALNVTLADCGEATTLVFDEVDSGVGGATASAVGTRLKTLASHRQILVVTHSPQVAAMADTHFLVKKQDNQADLSTTTHIHPLGADMRVDEIARMLSGAQITEEARAAALNLLEEGGLATMAS